MNPDDAPQTEPSNALVPPVTHPPTALALATPPPPRRARSMYDRLQADPRARRLVDNALGFVFDRADAIGDGIAELFGLRPKSAAPVARRDPVE